MVVLVCVATDFEFSPQKTMKTSRMDGELVQGPIELDPLGPILVSFGWKTATAAFLKIPYRE